MLGTGQRRKEGKMRRRKRNRMRLNCRRSMSDEIGFLHPSQFASLDEDSSSSSPTLAPPVQLADGNIVTNWSGFQFSLNKSCSSGGFRRWVIKILGEKCHNLQDTIREESDLVEKIAEEELEWNELLLTRYIGREICCCIEKPSVESSSRCLILSFVHFPFLQFFLPPQSKHEGIINGVKDLKTILLKTCSGKNICWESLLN
ncbi:hypothetical protein BHM03_00009740 [Ensete ventricosum]|nr:hypothetical protein BHM03_00009740 [Ensete ventricosum]